MTLAGPTPLLPDYAYGTVCVRHVNPDRDPEPTPNPDPNPDPTPGPTPSPTSNLIQWFTWWHAYTEDEAKDDLAHWEAGQLPVDVWALDMNWVGRCCGSNHRQTGSLHL